MIDEREYCRRRAAQELAAADTASSVIAATIHRELAQRFTARAEAEAAPRAHAG